MFAQDIYKHKTYGIIYYMKKIYGGELIGRNTYK